MKNSNDTIGNRTRKVIKVRHKGNKFPRVTLLHIANRTADMNTGFGVVISVSTKDIFRSEFTGNVFRIEESHPTTGQASNVRLFLPIVLCPEFCVTHDFWFRYMRYAAFICYTPTAKYEFLMRLACPACLKIRITVTRRLLCSKALELPARMCDVPHFSRGGGGET